MNLAKRINQLKEEIDQLPTEVELLPWMLEFGTKAEVGILGMAFSNVMQRSGTLEGELTPEEQADVDKAAAAIVDRARRRETPPETEMVTPDWYDVPPLLEGLTGEDS